MKVRIDALDVTVLRGGAADIGQWAEDHGFRLPPDAPEVLDFYASRSPIFLAAAFDADAAAERGQQLGDGTPVHVTIPTDNPWVPLRILALGKTGEERVEADVFLLTDEAPGAAAGAGPATTACGSTTAPPRRPRCSTTCGATAGMEWIPSEAWLTKVAIDADAASLSLRPRDRRQRGGRPVAGWTPASRS